jgi:hypothetical protein
MKKTLYILSLFISIVLFATSCQKDNYPYPNSQVFGAIQDSVGGALVETDLNSGSLIGAYEQGYATPVLRNWVIMQDGTYRNNFVFANTYNFVFQNSNFFPYTITGEVIKPGENQRDFQVVPYIRLKNVSITYDAANKKIKATFSIEGGKPTVKVSKVSLYAFTDMYVGELVKKSLTATATDIPTQSFGTNYATATTINTATVYSLSIDLTQAANAAVFAIHRDYFFRVGAMGINSTNVGTIRTNYAPYVKIAL